MTETATIEFGSTKLRQAEETDALAKKELRVNPGTVVELNQTLKKAQIKLKEEEGDGALDPISRERLEGMDEQLVLLMNEPNANTQGVRAETVISEALAKAERKMKILKLFRFDTTRLGEKVAGLEDLRIFTEEIRETDIRHDEAPEDILRKLLEAKKAVGGGDKAATEKQE